MTSDFDELLGGIDNGKRGGNIGIPMGLERFSEVIPNIQKSRYHLVVGESGSGKSAFVDTAYVFNPLDWYIKHKNDTDIKLKIFYYSFEISKERLLTKQISRKLFTDHGLLLDVNYILSFGKYRISDEHYKLVRSYKSYFDEISDYLVVKDGSETNNPTGIRQNLLDYAKENGEFSTVNKQLVYKENDPNLFTMVIVDHMAIVPKERGFNTKENMDKLSEYTVFLRNKCKFSFCYLIQANRSLGDIDRLKHEKSNLAIKLGDIKDSSNPAQDSDAVIGIINPWKYSIDEYRKYDISKLKNRQRFLNIAKNRDGEAEKSLGLLFLGEAGFYKELPRSEDMNDTIYNSILKLK